MAKKASKAHRKEPRIKNRLKLYRRAMGLTQKDLAFLIDKDPVQISRWERNRRVPKICNAIGLAVATHRLVGDLFSYYREEWQEKIRKKRPNLKKTL